ncbi:MAG: exosome complex RNA-binding protein Csl4 [Methanobacteriaceae archaeon]|jgi:exosome complex component CSL4|nr:exosome complex RNA-binding protein Csl4 [Methanobacteriaceae archaeon]
MKIEDGDFVMPGDFLGIIEQFLPDKGTYADKGDIKSNIIGNVSIENKKISIIPKTNKPSVLKIEDKVYAQITDLKGQRALINIDKLIDTDRQLALPYLGAIHISQVKKGYLEKLTDAFRIGDIIEAKIIKITGDNVDLNTFDEDCGVIKAICTRCRGFMKTTPRENELQCENCNKKERREISKNYVY